MPTYQNRSGELTTVGTTSLSPGKKIPLEYYLNIENYPLVFKIDELPKIRNGFFPLFENVSGPTNISNIYEFRCSLILQLVDITPFPVDTEIEIMAFVGITDDVKDFVPVKRFVFKKIIASNKEGISLGFWEAQNGYKLNQQLIDPYHEFVAFSVMNISGGSGSVNILLKSY